MCFDFHYKILSQKFLILRRNEQGVIKKCVLVFMWNTRYSWRILMKVEFSRQNFENNLI